LRSLIIIASLCAIATPLAAQPVRHSDVPAARRLPPPAQIEEMGDRLGRAADALMEVDVGPLADAIDPYRRPGRRETLGDIARRDDPYARERLHQSIGSTSAGMAAAMNELAILTPLLSRSIMDAMGRIDAAAHAGAYRRYPQRDVRVYDRDRDRDYDRNYDRDDDDRDYDRRDD
jgi:hypothetical protein